MTLENFDENKPAVEFFFENDASEILLNNLSSFNEREKDISDLISDIDDYGTDSMKEYLPYFNTAIRFWEENQRFPDIEELNALANLPAIPQRSEDCGVRAYLELLDNLKEEENVKQFRLVLRSKDIARISDFAKSLLPSETLPETDLNKILDIKALRNEGRKNNLFIKTGIEVFDKATYGFQNKTINTISAPSSGGKTTFAVNMAYNNALEGKLVVYFALESSVDEISASLISTFYKRTIKADTSYLENIFKTYNTFEQRQEFKAGTVNSIKFYKLSEETENILIDDYKNEITKDGGQIYVIDDNLCDLRSIKSLINILESIAKKEGRKVDIVVIDNADELTSFVAEDKYDADMTMVNKMINQLNAYSTTHYNGKGTIFLFLAQLNREGIRELAKQSPALNLTHISTYSNLYTKANVVATLSKNKEKPNYIELRILKNRHGKTTGNDESKSIYTIFEYCYMDNSCTSVEPVSYQSPVFMPDEDEDFSDITLEDDEFEDSDMMV